MASEVAWLAGRQALSAALTDEGAAFKALEPAGAHPGWTNRLGLLLLDVDGFGRLKAAIGQEAGDDLLTRVSERMRAVLRPSQTLVRLGGDEFAVFLPDADREVAERVAYSLIAQLDEPFPVPGAEGAPSEITVQVSVGVATCRLPRDDPRALVQRAAVGLRRTQEAGGGVGHGDDDPDSPRQPPLGELRLALEQGALEVYLQPQVRLRDGRICGTEALARWRHPKDGVLLPASFLPLAAQTGLMGPISSTVKDLAVAACAQWWHRGHDVPVSVNLSPTDLLDPNVSDRIPTCLEPLDLPPRALRIEITEEALLVDLDAARRLVGRWRAEGTEVALDDFGTGYSSLAYLRELPVAELKLDGIFAADIARPATATIVRHTCAMAHDLGLRVVAEGVEDAATARALAELGCDLGQGLFFGAAMPVHRLLERLAAN